ncbi:hypothetical protein VNI00_004393 [Paramarasmius palmivorus]|uniref:Uncharacterized protein n=1 Tax=Paramarasmius palmivorus TaxID=297713 RepID=A0AAW0DMM4_9AGAR
MASHDADFPTAEGALLYYRTGIKDGIRRHKAEMKAMKALVEQLGLENAQFRAKLHGQENYGSDREEISGSERASTEGDDSEFVPWEELLRNFPSTSDSAEASTTSSSASLTGPDDDNRRFGIPGYLSAFRSVESELALRRLFDKAHGADSRALTLVKTMCREAHSTSRDLRSWAQRFVLSEWRNPFVINSPTRDIGQVVIPNPRIGDPFEDWYRYYCVHPASLPRGVRTDLEGRPWKPDLWASRLAAQLRPKRIAPAVVRTEFNYHFVELLGTPGAYHQAVTQLGLRISSSLRPEPYNGPSRVTVEDVVQHMAACGISFHMARDQLEPWTRQYKTVGPWPLLGSD